MTDQNALQSAIEITENKEASNDSKANVTNVNDKLRILHTQLRIDDLRHIDTVKRTFCCAIGIWMRWKMSVNEEKKVLELKNDETALNEYLSTINPPTLTHSGIDIAADDIEYRCYPNKVEISLINGENDELQFLSVQYLNGTFRMGKDKKELTDFPFDSVEWQMLLRPINHTQDRFKLVIDKTQSTYKQDVLDIRPWKIHSQQFDLYMVELLTLNFKSSLRGGYWPCLKISFRAIRKHIYHFKHTVILVFILSTMIFPAYSIDVTSIGDRLSHLMTLLLAQAVFIQYLGGSLPKLSYFTILDEYILWNFALTLAVSIQMAITYFLIDDTEYESIDSGIKNDHYCFFVFIALFVILNVFYIIKSYRAWKRTNKKKYTLQQPITEKGFIVKSNADKNDKFAGRVCVYNTHDWEDGGKYHSWGKGDRKSYSPGFDGWGLRDRIVILLEDCAQQFYQQHHQDE